MWGLEADTPSPGLSLALTSDVALSNVLSVIDAVCSPA